MANEFRHGDVGTELTQPEWEGVGTHILNSQATGDTIYAASSSQLSRLPIGTSGQLMETSSGLPAWTSTPTIGSTSWANANHAHAASNSGGTLTTLGTISTGVWQATDIGVAYGGTGVSTLTANGVLIGNGSSAITSVDMSTKGHVLIGDGSGNPQMLGVGTNNHVLTADSGETTGVKWAAPAAAAAGSLTGSTLASGVTASSLTSVGTLSSLAITGSLTVGSNDTGHDAKFFGATSGKYMLWDESEDTLAVVGSIVAGNATAEAGIALSAVGSAAQIKADSGGDDHLYLYAGDNSSNSPAVVWTSGNLRFWGGADCFQIATDGGLFAPNLLAASASTDVNINGSDELHSVTSSEYYKYNKRSISIDTSLIYQLQPRSYKFGEKKADAPASWPESEGETDDFGLTAEEVYRVLPELVNMRDGKPYSVRYSMLPVLMLNEIKKLRNAVLV